MMLIEDEIDMLTTSLDKAHLTNQIQTTHSQCTTFDVQLFDSSRPFSSELLEALQSLYSQMQIEDDIIDEIADFCANDHVKQCFEVWWCRIGSFSEQLRDDFVETATITLYRDILDVLTAIFVNLTYSDNGPSFFISSQIHVAMHLLQQSGKLLNDENITNILLLLSNYAIDDNLQLINECGQLCLKLLPMVQKTLCFAYWDRKKIFTAIFRLLRCICHPQLENKNSSTSIFVIMQVLPGFVNLFSVVNHWMLLSKVSLEERFYQDCLSTLKHLMSVSTTYGYLFTQVWNQSDINIIIQHLFAMIHNADGISKKRFVMIMERILDIAEHTQSNDAKEYAEIHFPRLIPLLESYHKRDLLTRIEDLRSSQVSNSSTSC